MQLLNRFGLGAGDSLREALAVNVVSKSEDTGSARFDGTAAVLAFRGRTRKRPPLLPGYRPRMMNLGPPEP